MHLFYRLTRPRSSVAFAIMDSSKCREKTRNFAEIFHTSPSPLFPVNESKLTIYQQPWRKVTTRTEMAFSTYFSYICRYIHLFC